MQNINLIHILFLFSVVVCVQTVESLAEKIVFLIFYHFILALFVWSYLKTIFAPKCETPSKWKLSPGKIHSCFLRFASFKGGLISEGILIWVPLPTKGARLLPWAENLNFPPITLNNLPIQIFCSGEWFGTFYWFMGPNLKYLRLNHLYIHRYVLKLIFLQGVPTS